MIGLFPRSYDDELAYSVFARYYMYSGYMSYLSVAEDLYANPFCRPNMELCNALSNDVKSIIGSMEEFIINHTMLNYYCAFLSPDKQYEALKHAISMNIKILTNILPFPKSKYIRYMRYCPLCSIEDRNNYGEAYWHRSHQLYGISVCHKHGCYLIDTLVPMISSVSPILITAEEGIGEKINNIEIAKDIEVKLAAYAFKVLSIKPSSHNDIGTYFNHCLYNTHYISTRGATRNMKVLLEDFISYYRDIDLLGFDESWKIEKALTGKRFNPYELCLLSMFLGISPDEVVLRHVDKLNDPVIEFDNNIVKLREHGLNYKQISTQLGISYDYCKRLGVGTNKKYNQYPRHRNVGRRDIDWNTLDEQTLPKVKDLISRVNPIDVGRPKRLSIGYVERTIGLKEGQLSHLSKCLSYIKQYTISQEEHWAKCVAWAINELSSQDKPIHITNIQKLTNIRKKNLKASIPYLNKYIKDDGLREIEKLLETI